MIYNIKTYQTELKKLGFLKDVADGIYGPNTKAAVIAFQKSKGVDADGIVGPRTWELLFPKQSKAPILGDTRAPWVNELLKVRGLHEVQNYTALVKWLRSDGNTLGDPRKFPWCGDAVATALKLALPNINLPGNPYWVRNFEDWGLEVKPQYGAILVFERGRGGHIGFYMGETKDYYLVLGGNQGNSVTISRVAKNRCIGVRWPVGYAQNNKRIFVTGDKYNVTTNEF